LDHVRKVSIARKNDYINSLGRLPDIRNTQELIRLDLTDSQIKGLRNLIHFLEDVKGYDRILNIQPDRWLKNLKLKPSRPNITFVNDQAVEEGYWCIQSNIKTFYKLACYTGARGIHLIEMMHEFNSDNVIISDKYPDVSYYSISKYSRGNKNGFYIYFPSKFTDELVKYHLPYKHHSTIFKKLQDIDMPIKNLRKYHANLLLKCGIQESIVDYLQGRTPVTVIGRHYCNLHMQACRAYTDVIDKFPIFHE